MAQKNKLRANPNNQRRARKDYKMINKSTNRGEA